MQSFLFCEGVGVPLLARRVLPDLPYPGLHTRSKRISQAAGSGRNCNAGAVRSDAALHLRSALLY